MLKKDLNVHNPVRMVTSHSFQHIFGSDKTPPQLILIVSSLQNHSCATRASLPAALAQVHSIKSLHNLARHRRLER